MTTWHARLTGIEAIFQRSSSNTARQTSGGTWRARRTGPFLLGARADM
jgi:hypothetical protein